ncbi:MAG: DISARM system helicase DrmA [Dermatophilaceae bacterium]
MSGERPAYELAHEPDGTSWTARENLHDIVVRELLGPGEGDHEVIDAPPDTRYLLGRIAPTRLRETGQLPQAEEESEDDAGTLDLGDDLDARESRGLPMTAVDDSSVDADEDTGLDEPVKRGLMIPASMGLRFQVREDLDAVTVRASWGVYNPKATGEVSATGRAIRRYHRTPVEHPVTVRVRDLPRGETTTIPLQDDVVLRVDVYDDLAMGRRLVEVALCNDRETPSKIPVNAWLFQTALYVESDRPEAFLPVHDPLLDTRPEPDDELRRLALQYRDRLEFAIGRTCSVDWHVEPGARRASRVWTTWLPTAETPPVTAVDQPGAVLDMHVLATASAEQVDAGLRPIVDGYAGWLDEQRAQAARLPEHLRSEALDAVHEASRVYRQLAEGLDFLVGDAEALRCFRFMNRVMADQRVHTQVAALRAAEPSVSLAAARQRVLDKGPEAHSWFTFQIAFILLQIPALCQPGLPRRSGDLAKVELLFFPTGGGKTEAYLGLAAYTFAIRRRQGRVAAVDGELDGGAGVAVLMRYTLRLLTAQQFQRATTLVCAAELARREEPSVWGSEPFRIGLWVGTDVSPKRVDEAAKQLRDVNEGHGYRLTVLQIRRCPWCGTPLGSDQVRVDEVVRRVYVRCGDELGTCPFAEGGVVEDGLPVLTVDEEIYRLVPAFVIATVDKFARLAREGEAAALFGYVSAWCARHGYVHPDYAYCQLKPGAKHYAKPGHPAVGSRPAMRLRPPDLVIQDELHLITGALGTTVGLFEVAVDVLTSWQTSDGTVVKPLVVASSATVRNAADQVRGLYGRGVTVFPPRVLDAAQTYFSQEGVVSREKPGRRYAGVSTTGVRLTTAEIRIAEVLLAAGQLVLDRSGPAADPYLTLVGYFNATRELAGMTRYLQDDVQTALSKGRPWSGLPRRTGTAYGQLNPAELTARVSSADITSTLDAMAVAFDPAFDSTVGKRARREALERGEKVAERDATPYDVVLATSMLQVGVDVTRLGLMLMVGQPKNTAEYIQATSRVGRDPQRPGLVITLGNWARPRDLAHYEQFRHYHETFYAQVEPLSVTPFSVTALERGVEGLLVSAARVLQATRRDGLSPEQQAGRIRDEHAFTEALIDALVARVQRASDEPSADAARELLVNRRDRWAQRRTALQERGLALVYERTGDQSRHGPLMRGAESLRSRADAFEDAPFVVPNSMREVQPEINLLVSPVKERLFVVAAPGAPVWTAQGNGEADHDD